MANKNRPLYILKYLWDNTDEEHPAIITDILAHLEKAGYTDVRDLKTSDDIKDWNAGRIPIALIHPASAGHGLNIQEGGHILIWFGLTWSLELYQQTNARLWRQGQQADIVVIQHIITKGTIDERIMRALEKKDKSQTALMEAVRAQLFGTNDRRKR